MKTETKAGLLITGLTILLACEWLYAMQQKREIDYLRAHQPTNNVVEYNTGQQPGLSHCEYIVVRRPGQLAFEILCHKGDCKYCSEQRIKEIEFSKNILPLQSITPPVVTNQLNKVE